MVDQERYARLKEKMASGQAGGSGADSVLEELQKAVREHERILQQQELLIRRLREELKGVRRDGE